MVEAIARAEPGADNPEVLVVEAPPRHGKSEMISVHTPAWYLGTFPDRKVILSTYEADFAAGWGRRARSLLEDHGQELWGVSVDQASRARNRWNLAGRKGGMMTAGVGGPVTGKGAHLLIIDDPVKNAEQALSETIRLKHVDWWLTTARTRLEPGAVVVCLMTRWHEADLGGYLLANEPRARELRIPALALEGDPLGREPGEALWPERYPVGYLEAARERMGAYWFGAMYQGSPTPDEGGYFRREDFRYFGEEGDEVVLRDRAGAEVRRWGKQWLVRRTFVDLAASEKETADYTVVLVAWITPERELLVSQVYRARIPGPDQPEHIASHYEGTIHPEQIGYQTSLIQALLRRGLPVSPVHPDKDKGTRAASAGAHYRQGRVYHRERAEWLGDFEHELLAFPVGEHDDQVDALAYAARGLSELGVGQHKPQRSRGRTVTSGLSAGDT